MPIVKNKTNTQLSSKIDSVEPQNIKNSFLKNEKVRALSVGALPAIVGNILVGGICIWLLWGIISPATLIIWSLFLLAVQFFRLLVFWILQYSWKDIPLSHSLNWIRLSALANGLIWGSVSVFLFPDEFQYQFFLPFAVAAIVGGALGSYSADKISVFLYIFSALLPLITRFLMEDGEVYLAMAMLSVVYLFYLTGAAINSEKTFLKMFAMREQADAGITAKNIFIANMSHEIRTPLNAIRGMSELLENSVELDESERHSIIKVISTSTESLASILDDVLSYSQIETGLLELNMEIVSLHEAISSFVEIYTEEARSKNIELRLNFDENLPEWVNCDVFKLKQIVLNIISNAVKFTHQGSIDINVKLKLYRESSSVITIEIVDTGIGISPDIQKKLFDAFVQGEQSTNRNYGGSGLGLVISKRLARILGGNLTLESRLGKGTKVNIELELLLHKMSRNSPSIDQRAEHENISNPQSETHSESLDKTKAAIELNIENADRILIVDDNAINCMVLKRQLTMLGYQIEEANNGDSAFHMWESNQYAMVLTDCHMPGMDGYELAGKIRDFENQNQDLPYTPIIGYTADAGESSQQKCRSAGMDDILFKPVSIKMLQDCLSKHFVLKQLPIEISENKIPSVDWDKLNEITGGDREFGIFLLNSFLEEKATEIDLMLHLLKDKNVDQILALVHRMKGASESIAAEKMLVHCSTIEAAAKSGDFEFFSASIRLLPIEFKHLGEYSKQLVV